MNTAEFEKLIALLVDGQSLSLRQSQLLSSHIADNPHCLAQMIDDRALDGLLHLIAAGDDSEFVTRCLAEFESKQKPESAGGQSRAQSRPTLEIANDLALRKLSFSSNVKDEPVDQRITEIDTKSAYSRHKTVRQRKRGRFRFIAAILTLAASLMAVAAGAIWIGQSKPETAGRDRVGEVHDLASDKSIASNGALPQIDNEKDPAASLESPQDSSDPANSQAGRLEVAGLDDEQPSPAESKAETEDGFAVDAADQLKLDISHSPVRQPGFANLIQGDVVWKTASAQLRPADRGANPVKARVGSGLLELEEGVARVEFDNGVQVSMLGPAVMSVVDDRSVILQRGSFMAQLSPKMPEFEIAMGTLALTGQGDGLVQLTVNDQGVVEAYVASGEVTLRHTDDPKMGPMRLTDGKLNQAIVTPAEAETRVPSISVAQGNGTFLGQIGAEDSSLEIASPQMFSEVLKQLAHGKPAKSGLQQEFNQLLNGFGRVSDITGNSNANQSVQGNTAGVINRQSSLGQDSNSGSTVFHGSMNINGQQFSFDSQQEYVQALEQFVDGIGGENRVLGDSNPMKKFDLETGFEFQGRLLKFTLPEEFRNLRQKMMSQ